MGNQFYKNTEVKTLIENYSINNLRQISAIDEYVFMSIIETEDLIARLVSDNDSPDLSNNCRQILYNLTDQIIISKEKIEKKHLLNVAIVAPKLFFDVIEGFDGVFELFTKQQIIFLLCEREFSRQLLNHLVDNKFSLPSTLIIQCIVSNVALRLIDAKREIEVIALFFDKIRDDSYSSLVKQALETRLYNLTVQTSKTTPAKRIALHINGQLRGYERSIKKFVAECSNIDNVDVYVSTWEDLGYKDFSKYSLERIFDSESLEYINSNLDYHNIENYKWAVHKHLNNINENGQIRDSLTQLLSGFRNVYINIKSDKEYPFNNMFRPEKMYYHNAYWLHTQSKELISEYDYTVKIRPDIFVSGIDFSKLEVQSKTVYTEVTGGWIFRHWGFGIGDQIIHGPSNIVHKILMCHSDSVVASLLPILSVYSGKYGGHINCGIAAWLYGADLSTGNIKQLGFSPTRLLTISETRNIFGDFKS
ncbi:hypothetical protein ACEUBL_05525 [Aeromonas veronii]